jgi:hypothetical protein
MEGAAGSVERSYETSAAAIWIGSNAPETHAATMARANSGGHDGVGASASLCMDEARFGMSAEMSPGRAAD